MTSIPRSFQLGPYTIRVLIVSDARMQQENDADHDVNGLWSQQDSTIYVRRVSKGFPKERQLQVFWHEFFHALFDTLGYERISSNEQLVDQCGLLMLQAQQTFKYR